VTQPELSFGSRGASVRALQQLINEAERGHGLTRDGAFGPLTRAAVVRFQRRNRLETDGVVGPQTWAALGRALRLPQMAATAPPPAPRPQATPAPTKAAPAAASARPAAGSAAAAAARVAAASSPAKTPAKPAPAPRRALPVPTGPVDTSGAADPPWYQVALAEFAAHHTVFGTADGNKRIHEYFLATSLHPGVGTKDAWCSAFANWCMKQAGIQGTNNALAVSWRNWGVGLDQPRHGCIMTVQWTSGGHHVTFFDRNNGDHIMYFGGNQGKAHAITQGQARRSAFSRVDFRWPK
jgi:uncharacterized protein (TIGR02594 family)